jgi:cytochrome c oxidase subunit 2
MKIHIRLLAAFFVCALVAVTGSIASADPITVTASSDGFAPASITVHVNQPVTIALTSSGGVHGVQSSELGISQTMIEPGSTSNVTFTPKKVGDFILHCSVPCGPGHAKMALAIHVVP